MLIIIRLRPQKVFTRLNFDHLAKSWQHWFFKNRNAENTRVPGLRFESCSPNEKAEKTENLKFSIFSKSHKKCLKTCKFNDLQVFFVLGLFSIFIKAHKIKGAESVHFQASRKVHQKQQKSLISQGLTSLTT